MTVRYVDHVNLLMFDNNSSNSDLDVERSCTLDDNQLFVLLRISAFCSSTVNKRNKAQQSPLCHVFVTVFSLKGVQIINGLENEISLHKMENKNNVTGMKFIS